MIRVDQTTFGGKDSPPAERGDCFSACLASILELRLDAVPRFCELEALDWAPAINTWLMEHGLYYLECQVDGTVAAGQIEIFGYHVLSGLGPRGHRHSVVALGETIAHDPHPSRAGLLPDAFDAEWSRGFLINFDPARYLR